MTDKIHCKNCGKLLAMRLEGELEIYCPRCHHFSRVIASTAQVAAPHLTIPEKYAIDKTEP